MSVTSDDAQEVSDSESEDWCMITLGTGSNQDEKDTLTSSESKPKHTSRSALQSNVEELELQNNNETVDLQEQLKDIRHLSFMHVYNDSMNNTNFNEKIAAVINSSTHATKSELDTMNTNPDAPEVMKESYQLSLWLPNKSDIDVNVVQNSEDPNFDKSSNVLEAPPNSYENTQLSHCSIGSNVSSYERTDNENNKTIHNQNVNACIKEQKINEFAKLSKLFHGLSSETDFLDSRTPILNFDMGETSQIQNHENSISSPINDISTQIVSPNMVIQDKNLQNITKTTLELISNSPTLFEFDFTTKIAGPKCKSFLSNSLEFSDSQGNAIDTFENPKLISNILPNEHNDRSSITKLTPSDPLSPNIIGSFFDTKYVYDKSINEFSSATDISRTFSGNIVDDRKVIANEMLKSVCSENTSSTKIDETFLQDSLPENSEILGPMNNLVSVDDSSPSSLTYSCLGAQFYKEIESEPTINRCKLSQDLGSEELGNDDAKSNAASSTPDLNYFVIASNTKKEAMNVSESTPTSPTSVDILPLFENELQLDAAVSYCKPAIECSEKLSINTLRENLVITDEKTNSACSIISYNNDVLALHTVAMTSNVGGEMHNSISSDDSSPSSLTYSGLGALFDTEIESEPAINGCKLSLALVSEELGNDDTKPTAASSTPDLNYSVIACNTNEEAMSVSVSTPTSPTSLDILPLFENEFELDASVSYCKPATEYSKKLSINTLRENLVITNEKINSACSIKSYNNDVLALHTVAMPSNAGGEMHNAITSDDLSPSSLTYSDLGVLFDTETESKPTINGCKLSLDLVSEELGNNDTISNAASSTPDLNYFVIASNTKKEAMNVSESTPTSPTSLDILPLFENELQLDASVSYNKPATEYSKKLLSVNTLKENLVFTNEINSACSINSYNKDVLALHPVTMTSNIGGIKHNSISDDSSPSSLTYSDLGALFDTEIESEPTINGCKISLDLVSEELGNDDAKSNTASSTLDLNYPIIASDTNKGAMNESLSTPTSPTLIDILPLFENELKLDATVFYCKPAIEHYKNLSINTLKENQVITNEKINSACLIKSYNNEMLALHPVTMTSNVESEMHNSVSSNDSTPSSLTYSNLGALFDAEIEEPTNKRCRLSFVIGSVELGNNDNKSNVAGREIFSPAASTTTPVTPTTPLYASSSDGNEDYLDCKSEPENSESSSNCDLDSKNTSNNENSNINCKFTSLNSNFNSSAEFPKSYILPQPECDNTVISFQSTEKDLHDSSSAHEKNSMAYSDLTPFFLNESGNSNEVMTSSTDAPIDDFLNRNHESDMEMKKRTLQSGSGFDHSYFPTHNSLESQLGSAAEFKYEFEICSFSPSSLDLHKLISTSVEMRDDKIEAESNKSASLSSPASPSYFHINSIDSVGEEGVVTNILHQQHEQEESHEFCSNGSPLIDKLNYGNGHCDNDDAYEADFNFSLNDNKDSAEIKQDKSNLICSIAHLFRKDLDYLANATSSNSSSLSGITSIDNALLSENNVNIIDETKKYFDSLLIDSDEDVSLKSSLKDHFKSPTFPNIDVLLNSDINNGDDNLDELKSGEIYPNCLETVNEQKTNNCVPSSNKCANYDIGVSSYQSNSEDSLESQSYSEFENSSKFVPCLQLNALFIPDIDGVDFVEDKITPSKSFEQQDAYINSNLNKKFEEAKAKVDTSFPYDTNEILADYELVDRELANEVLAHYGLADKMLAREELTDEELTDEELTDDELTDDELTDEDLAYEKVANIELQDKELKYEKQADEELREVELDNKQADKVLTEDELTDEEQANVELTDEVPAYEKFANIKLQDKEVKEVEQVVEKLADNKQAEEELTDDELTDEKQTDDELTDVNLSDKKPAYEKFANIKLQDKELKKADLADEKLADEELREIELDNKQAEEELTDDELTDEEQTDEEQTYVNLSDKKPACEKFANIELTDKELKEEELSDEKLSDEELKEAKLHDELADEKQADEELTIRNYSCLVNEYDSDDLMDADGHCKMKSSVLKEPKLPSYCFLEIKNSNQEFVICDSLTNSDDDNDNEETEDGPSDRDLAKTPDSSANIPLNCESGNDDVSYLQNPLLNVELTYDKEREFLNSSFELCDDEDLSYSESEYYEKYENVDALNDILGNSFETAENCSLRDIINAELEINKHNIDICEFKKIIREIHDLKILLGMAKKESSEDNEKDYGIEEDEARSEVSSYSDIEKIVTAQANDNDACESDLESISDDSTCGTLDLVSLFSLEPSFDVTNKDTNSILAESVGGMDCKHVTFSDINCEAIKDSCTDLDDEIRSTVIEPPCNINTISEDIDFQLRNQNALDNIFYSNGRYCILKNQINNFCNFFSTLSQIFCKSENNVCASLRDPTKEKSSSLHGTYVSFHLPVDRSSPNVVETEPSPCPLFDITRITPIPSTEMPPTYKLSDDRMSPFPFQEQALGESELDRQSSADLCDANYIHGDKNFSEVCMEDIFFTDSGEYFSDNTIGKKKLQSNKALNIESKRENYIYQLRQNSDNEFCKKNESALQDSMIKKSTNTLKANIEISKY